MFSSRRHPKHSTAEYCLILFSFLVMFKAGYCFFPFLNKICLVLSSAQCIDSLLSINHSQEAFRCFSIELTFLLLKRRQVSSAYGRKSQSLKLISYHLHTIRKLQDPKWTLEELQNLKHLLLRSFSQGLQ